VISLLRCGSREVATATLVLPKHASTVAEVTGVEDDWLRRALNPKNQVMFLNTDTMVPNRIFLESRSRQEGNGVDSEGGGVLSNQHEVCIHAC
jgi:hypothetical protein